MLNNILKLLIFGLNFYNINSFSNTINPNVFIPDIEKRKLMNSILLTSVYGSCGTLAVCYVNFFVPPGLNNNKNSGLIAKDKNGDDIIKSDWVKTHSYPSRALVQGLKGDAYYLITTKNEQGKEGIEKYALNAVCTHLGCVVPWNVAENKFMCPCHGSQYDTTGKVIRGPAPRSLALANVEEENEKIMLKAWTDTDFRTGENPWWI
tara:strand:+ start:458 stop:1075 length:618 start_codon:yes stop_codon:yes gene_type:complete